MALSLWELHHLFACFSVFETLYVENRMMHIIEDVTAALLYCTVAMRWWYPVCILLLIQPCSARTRSTQGNCMYLPSFITLHTDSGTRDTACNKRVFFVTSAAFCALCLRDCRSSLCSRPSFTHRLSNISSMKHVRHATRRSIFW